MRREGLAREARGRDRRLLDVDPLAVDVGRGQDQRRGRADRGDDVALGGLVPAELEHLVARDLRIVGREVARLLAVIMVDAWCGQLASIGRWQPPQLVVQLRWQVKQAISLSGWASSLSGTPAPNTIAAGLGAACATSAWRGPSGWLKQGPGVAWSPVASQGGRLGSTLSRTWLTSHSRFGIDDRALDQHPPAVALDPFEAAAAVLVADQLEIGAARRRGGAGGAQIGIVAGGAVAVAAADLDRVGDLAVDEAVAVRVLARSGSRRIAGRARRGCPSCGRRGRDWCRPARTGPRPRGGRCRGRRAG